MTEKGCPRDMSIRSTAALTAILAVWMFMMMFLFWCSLGCPPREYLPPAIFQGISVFYLPLFSNAG